MILVTGGAGFIGGNFVLDWLKEPKAEGIVNLDKLTYAGNLATLDSVRNDPRHVFVQGDIGDHALVSRLLKEHQPRAIINFAAESHVDRSIHGPAEFVQTNIVGTFNLLECARAYWNELDESKKQPFAFIMYLPMRCMVLYRQVILLLRRPTLMSPIAPIQHQRPHQIIWCGPGFIPTDFRL